MPEKLKHQDPKRLPADHAGMYPKPITPQQAAKARRHKKNVRIGSAIVCSLLIAAGGVLFSRYAPQAPQQPQDDFSVSSQEPRAGEPAPVHVSGPTERSERVVSISHAQAMNGYNF